MNSLAEKYGRGLFAKHIAQYQPQDPLYETYVDSKGRSRRRKRELPPGLTKQEEAILRSVKRRAHYLDKGFNVCGLRFGWTFIIGIIPGAGDAADAALGYFLVIRKARKADIPPWLTQRMLLNLGLATSVGLVPLVGDVLLAAWRANSRNAHLLEEFLRVRGAGAADAQPADGPSAEAGAASGVSSAKGKGKGRVGKSAAGDVELVGRPDAEPVTTATPESGASGKSRRSWGWKRGSREGREKEKDGKMPGGLGEVGKRDSRFVEDVR